MVADRGRRHAQVGDLEVKFLHTPGHTPGSQCFLVDGNLVSGDTLFIGSCGRVDLPGSSPEDLFHSLNGTLKALPSDTVLYPGHNYADRTTSTIADERKQNPYMRFERLEDFLSVMGYSGAPTAPTSTLTEGFVHGHAEDLRARRDPARSAPSRRRCTPSSSARTASASRRRPSRSSSVPVPGAAPRRRAGLRDGRGHQLQQRLGRARARRSTSSRRASARATRPASTSAAAMRRASSTRSARR